MAKDSLCPYCGKVYQKKRGYNRMECCYKKRCQAKHRSILNERAAIKKREYIKVYKKEHPNNYYTRIENEDKNRELCKRCHQRKIAKGNSYFCFSCFSDASEINEDAIYFV